MRRSWALGAALVVAWGLIAAAQAEVKLPAVIGDNMVLQNGRPVVLWGQARRLAKRWLPRSVRPRPRPRPRPTAAGRSACRPPRPPGRWK